MISENLDAGMSIRAIREVFSQAEALKDKTIQISVSFLQIYNEKVYDLLNASTYKGNTAKTGLKLRWNKTE